ncbi:hypothetical protein P7H55_09445 [Vagococcus lutrae]|uniref:hypothetical protein n=1 Tax=Vagococcus lutrae TaxID=81947 RepID=UPI00288FAA49|nr:hypothetical protein [Vagococcus lutrae]MDT2818063.1 hypothetical protein [Vagococcus lutrae]
MVEEDRLVFDKSIYYYMKDIVDFIQDRLSPHEYADSITIRKGKRNNRDYIKEIAIHIIEKKFNGYEDSEYSVTIKEKVTPIGSTKVYTKKYTYELTNDENMEDLVRFDYFPYSNFPHFHINANEEEWGNHLTFPETTNLNLEKLDVIKALNIFQKYVADPSQHILDKSVNEKYVSVLEGDK